MEDEKFVKMFNPTLKRRETILFFYFLKIQKKNSREIVYTYFTMYCSLSVQYNTHIILFFYKTHHSSSMRRFVNLFNKTGFHSPFIIILIKTACRPHEIPSHPTDPINFTTVTNLNLFPLPKRIRKFVFRFSIGNT